MILGIILLSIALLVCLYPVISNFTAVKYQSIVQTRYEKAVSNMDDETLKKAKEAALAYNRTLIPGVADNLSFSEEALKAAAENYENLLNIRGDGIMGYVEIPKIDVNTSDYESERLQRLFEKAAHSTALDSQLLKSSVAGIYVESLSVKLLLWNGQYIGKDDFK